MTRKRLKVLPQYVKKLYMSVNHHRLQAELAEAKLSEWFEKNGLEMICYDEDDYLPFLSGNVERVYPTSQDALDRLDELYQELLENNNIRG